MSDIQLPQGVPAYQAGTADAPRALVVIQEAFGVNSHIKDVAERFAREGFDVVAPYLFHRESLEPVEYDDFPKAMGLLATLTREGIEHDVRAAVSYLEDRGHPRESIGMVGYCMGGTVTLFSATLGIIGAAATYYGGGVLAGRFGLPSMVEMAPSIGCPWLGLYGDLDKGIPVEQVEALREAAAQSSSPTDIVRYADADHGFHCDNRTAVFNADAASDAYRRTLDFFAENLRAR
mgnify:FL=1